MTGMAPIAGSVRSSLFSRSLIAAGTGLACVAVTACNSSIGPVHLRIQTGGVRCDNFVMEPVQEYGRLHGSRMVEMDPQVVASEEDLTLPEFSVGRTFTTLLVSAYHPEFVYVWAGEPKPSNGEMAMALQPQSWVDFLEEHRQVSLRRVESHLDLLQLKYVPVFEAGEPRERLRRYIPGLRALVESASWLSGDSGSWASEEDARADLQEKLQALLESMQ